MSELIDIYDDNYNYYGIEDKKIAHENGLWHRVFTCQIINSKDEITYFQRKNPNKYSFFRPDYLDISVGGHYKAGEKIEDGIRELYEETGIDRKEVHFEDLIPLGIRQTASTLAPDYIANEFQHIFLCDYRGDIHNLVKQNNETKGFVGLGIQDTIDLLLRKVSKINGNSCYIESGRHINQNITVTIEDFIPNYLKIDKFILRLMLSARRYLLKEDRDYLFW